MLAWSSTNDNDQQHNNQQQSMQVFDKHSMIMGFPSCQKWLSFSVEVKLLLWLVVTAVVHN
jgi:hypothetical protein